LDDPQGEYYNELAIRLEAKESIGIPAIKADCYDNAPAKLLEDLLTLSSELKKASTKWQSEKNTK